MWVAPVLVIGPALRPGLPDGGDVWGLVWAAAAALASVLVVTLGRPALIICLSRGKRSRLVRHDIVRAVLALVLAPASYILVGAMYYSR